MPASAAGDAAVLALRLEAEVGLVRNRGRLRNHAKAWSDEGWRGGTVGAMRGGMAGTGSGELALGKQLLGQLPQQLW